ncbi:MAG: hypothetical protein QXQ70_05890 [Candidatus Caldarchaeum sp.]
MYSDTKSMNSFHKPFGGGAGLGSKSILISFKTFKISTLTLSLQT